MPKIKKTILTGRIKKFLRMFFVAGVCLLPPVSYAQSEILFRPGPGLNNGTDEGSVNAGKDALTNGTDGFADTNYGSYPSITGTPDSNCNNAEARAYIKFELSALPL